jgi:hypothetical protein
MEAMEHLILAAMLILLPAVAEPEAMLELVAVG